jgi:hypothetical protein
LAAVVSIPPFATVPNKNMSDDAPRLIVPELELVPDGFTASLASRTVNIEADVTLSVALAFSAKLLMVVSDS